ncbi:MAG: S9 family peptidase [Pseudomonadota bacterium]
MKFLLLGVFCIMSLPASADTALTFERILSEPSLYGPTAGRLTFSPDGKQILFLRPSEADVSITDLWSADVQSGKSAPLLAYKDVAQAGAALSEAEKARRERQRIKSSGIVGYSWPKERSDRLLVPVDGRLMVVDLSREQPQVSQLTDAETFETDARFSPDGAMVSFIRGGGLYIQPAQGGSAIPFSPAATPTISYGVAEFVAQEEMDRDTGYWWSPDGKHIAYTMIDEAPVDVIQRVDIGAQGATIIEQRYPRAGTTNALVRLFVAPISDPSAYQEIDLGREQDIYLARVSWLSGSDGLLVQRQSRNQQTLDVLEADIKTGKTKRLWQETAQTWVNLHHDLEVLEAGQGFIWASERTGYKHLYLLTRGGDLVRSITAGSWQVDAIEAVDEENEQVFFTGRMDATLEKHLYVVSYDTPGVPIRVTKEGYWNEVTVSPDFKTVLINRSSPAQPPQVGLFAQDGDLIRWIEENALDETHPYAPYLADHIMPEYGTITRPDGTALEYMLLLPQGKGKVPALLDVYGGPHAQLVRRSFGALNDQVYAQRFALMRLDNRGAGGRGHVFEAPLYKAMGGPEVEDQRLALEFLANHPRVHAERIGVMGWSYGGYMTLKLLMQHGDLIAAGVSGAPVTKWELYDTHYTERYMGQPAEDSGANYERSNVFADIDGLSTPLLLIHGMADDNVLLDHSTALMEALQSKSVPFETMLYPGQKHGFRGQGVRQHVAETTMRFFLRHLFP